MEAKRNNRARILVAVTLALFGLALAFCINRDDYVRLKLEGDSSVWAWATRLLAVCVVALLVALAALTPRGIRRFLIGAAVPAVVTVGCVLAGWATDFAWDSPGRDAMNFGIVFNIPGLLVLIRFAPDFMAAPNTACGVGLLLWATVCSLPFYGALGYTVSRLVVARNGPDSENTGEDRGENSSTSAPICPAKEEL
jgi:hypothetical protein